ncbi:MAG: penicillin-binding protein 2 [Cyanobacteria bacterium J06638_20]
MNRSGSTKLTPSRRRRRSPYPKGGSPPAPGRSPRTARPHSARAKTLSSKSSKARPVQVSVEGQKRRSDHSASRLSLWNHPKIRLIMVWMVLMLGVLGLLANLMRLQVFYGDELQARAQEQQTLRMREIMPRRPIVDRNGNVVAVDRPAYTLYAHPMMFNTSQQEIAEALSPIINRPVQDLIQLFRSGETGLRVVDRLPEAVANSIYGLRQDGLELVQGQERLYPQQDLYGEIVGFVNSDRLGQAGLEMSYEERLQQPMREVELRRTGMGSVLPNSVPEDFPAADELRLRLTVDSRLQRAVQQALRETVEAHGAQRGTVIVMDVKTGEIRSLVTEPTFNPNQFYRESPERYRNWAVSDLYEPGSTFKSINLAIALESGQIQPGESVVDDGQIFIGEWTIQNSDYEYAGPRGSQTLTDVLRLSSNVGMVRVMQHLSADEYHTWLETIGLGSLTGIDLPSEIEGILKSSEDFSADPVEAATAAFGQGLSLTPIQMIQLQSSLANGGMLVTPHVVAGMVDADNQLQWTPDRPAPRQIFSPQTTQAVLQMMEAVVDNGTGEAAQIPGYRVAGKTGTAQKASPEGGYIDGARVVSFVSLFPSDNPQYSILAIIDEPQGADAYGGTVAAPLVRTVIESIITTLGVPPSRPDELGGDRWNVQPIEEPIYEDEGWEDWEGWESTEGWSGDEWDDQSW